MFVRALKVRELNQTGSPFDNNRANRTIRSYVPEHSRTLQKQCSAIINSSQARGDQSIDAAIK